MNVFELFGTIAIDNSSAERSLDKTVGHARDTESKLERTFKNIGKVIAAAFAIDKIKDFGKACTEAYASIAAEESAFAQIMGEYADTAQKKLEAVSDATGITATRMTTHMTSLTAKFKGLGYNVEDATTLATDGLMIAADAAAFWDMSLDESMSHLNSFINGSYEGGEAIGLFANETQMAAYAVEKGIVADAKAWATLDEATKQATRLDYAKTMMEQSGATGQAAKEAGAYANVMAELKEAWRQFQGVIGKPILEKLVLPAMQKLIKFMPGLTEAVQGGIDWLLEAFDKVASYFGEVFTEDGLNMDALPAAFANMFRDVARAVPRWLASIGRTLKNAWTNIVWPAVQGVAAKIGIDLPEWSEIEQKVTDWWDGGNGIKQEIANACNWVLNMFGAPADVTAEEVSDVLDSWWTGAKKAVQDTCTWVLQLFQNPTEQIGKVQQEVLKWWSYAKHWVSSVCKWALNLFGVPEAKVEAVKNLVSGWWIKMKGAAQSALVWTLQLFQNPKETVAQIKTKVSTWWAGVVNAVKGTCQWALGIFNNPSEGAADALEVVSGWWKGIKSKIEETIGIDLPNINIAGIFDAGKTAIDNLVAAAGTLYNDIKRAIIKDKDGKIKLDTTLSNLFDAGVKGAKNLLSAATTLVADIVGAITGNEEDAQKVGKVFEELFGVAEEVLVGIKDAGVGVFEWFLENGETVKPIIKGVATAFAFFALSNPAVRAIGALVALFVDWDKFAENYPELVSMFESLTGMDFSTVTNTLGGLQEKLEGIIAYFSTHKDELNALLIVLGGIAFASGHPLLGAALVAGGGMGTYESFAQEAYANFKESMDTDNGPNSNLVRALMSDELEAKLDAGATYDDLTDEEKREYDTVKTVAGVEKNVVDTMDHHSPLGKAAAVYQNGPPTLGLDNVNWDKVLAEPVEDVVKNMDFYEQLVPGFEKRYYELLDSYGQGGNGGGGNAGMVDGLYTRGSGLPMLEQSNGMLAALMNVLNANNEAQAAAMKEAVVDGLAGVTIEGNVTTGDVRLNEGTLVGALFPKIDMKLGWASGMHGRG